MSIRVGLLALALLVGFADTAWAQVGPAGRNQNPQGADPAAAAGALICMGVAVVLGLGIKIWIIVFIVGDAKKRGMDPTVWVILEIFVGLVGLIVYLCVREPLLSERRRGRRDSYDDDDDIRRSRRRRDEEDEDDDRDRRRRDEY